MPNCQTRLLRGKLNRSRAPSLRLNLDSRLPAAVDARTHIVSLLSTMGSVGATRAPAVVLTFSMTYSASYGDRLYVCGSTPELGQWDLSQALPLKWHTSHIWSATVVFSPPGPSSPSRFEYKFVVADAAAPKSATGRQPLWEPGDNHAVDLAPGATVAALPHTWGDLVSHDILPCKGAAAMLASKDHAVLAGGPGGAAAAAVVLSSPPPTPAQQPRQGSPSDPVSLAAARLESSSAASPEPLLVAATFRVSLPCRERSPDDAVYVVGSVPSLGNWEKAHSVRLRLLPSLPQQSLQQCQSAPALPHVGPHSDDPHDTWQVSLMLPQDTLHRRFEYKYLMRRAGLSGERVWEPGPNRIGTLCETNSPSADRCAAADTTSAPTRLLWEDRWDKLRCEFSIFYPTEPGSFMHVTGDPLEIGGWFKRGPVPLHLGAIERLETDVRDRKWRVAVYMPRSTNQFSYRYLTVNKEKGKTLWEREPNRWADFIAYDQAAVKAAAAADAKAAGSSSTQSPHFDSAISMPDNSVRYLRDVNFVATMVFDAVPPGMFVGPYPQTAADVDALADAGATAVFNVQTDEDIAHRGINMDDLNARYNERRVKLIRYPIRDFDRDSLAARIHGAAHEMNNLISAGDKVYIHCTAGMGRAPAVAVAYLCWVHGYQLGDAIAHVKKHRPVAVPNEPVLRQALQRPFYD